MSKFIVTFKTDTPASVIDKEVADVEAQGGSISQKYDSDFLKGFAATLPEGKVQTLSSNPHVCVSNGTFSSCAADHATPSRRACSANVEADQEVKTQ